jgi:hypothetical protein
MCAAVALCFYVGNRDLLSGLAVSFAVLASMLNLGLRFRALPSSIVRL